VADIFISYSKEHPQPTRDVAAFLKKEGYSVWWDTDLTAGEIFRARVEQELDVAEAEQRDLDAAFRYIRLGDIRSSTCRSAKKIDSSPCKGLGYLAHP
jgi:hypothetical protein